MKLSMRWADIKSHYPEQWVSLVDIQDDESGIIQSGVVVASGPDVETVTNKLKEQALLADRLEYTGRIKNFLGFAKWDIGNAQAE
jgi:hypothetical protein